MRAIGAISGTSMDGIDVALIDTDGENSVRAGPGATYPYPAKLRDSLLQLAAEADRLPPERLAAFEAPVTDAHVDAIGRFMADHAIASVELIGLHGQTVLHQPAARRTVQLGDGAAAARRLGIVTVDGFRLADVAAGGQGAPFAPLYHRALLAGQDGPAMVLNLGGVGNVTYLDGEVAIAFDTGPASAMLDDFVARRTGAAFDRDGALAATGRVHQDLVAAFRADPFFALPPPKSLDRQHFHAYAASVAALSDADGAATLAAFTLASVIAALDHVPRPPTRWLVTGGGRRNRHFMDELQRMLGVPVQPVEQAGWDGDFLEAQAFGYLAVRAMRGLPLSLPSTTGAPYPMPGGRLHPP
jgi:anhydro-N-acetylmuramic acid kinase